MFKLNNNGWGMNTFLVFIAVFCIAILLITVGAIKLGISSDNKTSNLPITDSDDNNDDKLDSNVYADQMNNYRIQIENGGKNYIKINNISIKENDSLTLTVKTLIDDNQISKYQINGFICTGYVTIQNGDKYEYNVYVNCGNNLITDGYNPNLDEIIE